MQSDLTIQVSICSNFWTKTKTKLKSLGTYCKLKKLVRLISHSEVKLYKYMYIDILSSKGQNFMESLNPLSDNKIFALSKLKAFADQP